MKKENNKDSVINCSLKNIYVTFKKISGMEKANYQSASILPNLSKISEEIKHCQASLLFEDFHISISLA